MPNRLLLGQSEGYTTAYAPHGGIFTPKGTLRILLVFAGFKDAPQSNPAFRNEAMTLERWAESASQRGLPDYVNPITGACPEFLYNHPDDVERYNGDINNLSISKLFNLMSQPKEDFRLIAEVFRDSTGLPIRVDVDPTGAKSWGGINQRVIQRMKELHPNADYSRFDQRENNPQFRFDNSDPIAHPADGELDYVVFWYRYKSGWAEQPVPGQERWIGSEGGYANLDGVQQERLGKLKVTTGFTGAAGGGLGCKLFIHELAHSLYNCPHFHGINGTLGNYFYKTTAGWSATTYVEMTRLLSAWERWYLGYIDPVADIRTASQLKQGNSFILRDFATTGDAIRIELPFSGGQHLWLENHQKLTPFDEHSWAGFTVEDDGFSLPPLQRGVYAYYEDMSGSHEQIAPVYRANSMKLLDGGGNWDYSRSTDFVNNLWGNPRYNFTRLQPNPIAGSNPLLYFRDDYNGDGVIRTDVNFNSAQNEGGDVFILSEKMEDGGFAKLYRAFGGYDEGRCAGYVHPICFLDGDEINLSSNPVVTNYPTFDMKNQRLQPQVIAGVGLKFRDIGGGDYLVSISLRETTMQGTHRWCGDIVLPNITGDSLPDLELQPNTTLLLDKSGTINRSSKTAAGDFINPTVLTVRAGATLRLKKGSELKIINSSTLRLEAGATLLLERGASLSLSENAQFDGGAGRVIRKKGSRWVEE